MAKEDHLYELHEGGKNYLYYAWKTYIEQLRLFSH